MVVLFVQYPSNIQPLAVSFYQHTVMTNSYMNSNQIDNENEIDIVYSGIPQEWSQKFFSLLWLYQTDSGRDRDQNQ